MKYLILEKQFLENSIDISSVVVYNDSVDI